MNENKKWYAVHTRPGYEKKVSEVLNRKKIENYCPLNKVMRPLSDHKKTLHEPLFSFHTFIRISENEMSDLVQTNGVINFVYWLGKPAVICDSEIETIKAFLKEYATVKLEKIDVNRDPVETISESSFIEREDRVQNVRNKTARVILPSLGYSMIATSEKANTEVIFRSLTPEVTSQAG